MAGDWIKLETVTPDKPEMFALAEHLACSHGDAFLACIRVWIWADQQSRDGHALGVTKTAIDRVAGVTGFADALHSVGWLQDRNGVLSVPNFDRHNGKSAKGRALAKDRQVTKRSRPQRDRSVTREEKRRGSTPVVPLNLPAGVTDADWQAFRDHRSANRKRLTPRAEELACAKLHALAAKGFDPKRLLEHAIEAGWATFYEREECRADGAQPQAKTVDIGACACGALATLKVGGKPRCAAHARGLEVAA